MDVFAIGRFGLDAVGAVASASLDLAAIPLREGARILAGEPTDLTTDRRSWRGAGRAWIEVRGLDDPDGGDAVAEAVQAALRARADVTSVRLNRPLARVIVEIGDDVPLAELCAAVRAAEQSEALTDTGAAALPGDGLLLAAKGAMVGANAVGLAIATTGSLLRWRPRPRSSTPPHRSRATSRGSAVSWRAGSGPAAPKPCSRWPRWAPTSSPCPRRSWRST